MKFHSLYKLTILLFLPLNLASPTPTPASSQQVHNRATTLQRRQNQLIAGLPDFTSTSSDSASSDSASSDSASSDSASLEASPPRFSYRRESWTSMNNAWLQRARNARVIDKLTTYIRFHYHPSDRVPDPWGKKIALKGGGNAVVDFRFQVSPQYSNVPADPVTWADLVDALRWLRPGADPSPWDNAVVFYSGGDEYREVAWMKFEEGRGGSGGSI